MRKYLFLLSFLLSNFVHAQIGINTNDPKAVLDIVDTESTYKILKMSPISNNVTNTNADINYTKGQPLYIDDNGYVFAAYTPVLDRGLALNFDNRSLTTSTEWTTIYTLPHIASIADFRFFTNLSLGSNRVSSASGRMSVGYEGMINLYGYNATGNVPMTVTGNLSSYLTMGYQGGASLEFQLTADNQIQVRLSKAIAASSNSNITIYESSVTRVK